VKRIADELGIAATAPPIAPPRRVARQEELGLELGLSPLPDARFDGIDEQFPDVARGDSRPVGPDRRGGRERGKKVRRYTESRSGHRSTTPIAGGAREG
jgi:hypothetical protein